MNCLCQTCGNPTGKKPNAKYCDVCAEQWAKHSAWRYKLANGIYVWVRGQIKRAVIDGKNVEPIREQNEVQEWD